MTRGNWHLNFRAWDRHLGRFIHFTLRDSYGHLPTDIPDEHIHQCLGIIASTGEYVYEGDIVELSSAPYLVARHSTPPPLHYPDGSRDLPIIETGSISNCSAVVGNIFEPLEAQPLKKSHHTEASPTS
jgi:hypothetical protein